MVSPGNYRSDKTTIYYSSNFENGEKSGNGKQVTGSRKQVTGGVVNKKSDKNLKDTDFEFLLNL
jgi:hypothetical protein